MISKISTFIFSSFLALNTVALAVDGSIPIEGTQEEVRRTQPTTSTPHAHTTFKEDVIEFVKDVEEIVNDIVGIFHKTEETYKEIKEIL